MIILIFVNKLPSCDKPKSNPFLAHSKIVSLSFIGHMMLKQSKNKNFIGQKTCHMILRIECNVELRKIYLHNQK